MIDIMVHYMTKPRAVATQPADTAAPDDIRLELAAMHAVGTAIGELRDHDARLRILRWAMERFHPDFAKAPTYTPLPQAARAADPDLSEDNLDGLFENDAPVVNVENDAPVVNFGNDAPVVNFGNDAPVVNVENDAPVVNVGNDAPVVNFWNDAPVVNVGNDAPVVNIGRRPGQPEPELGSLVQDFVVDFQQLASEWQRA